MPDDVVIRVENLSKQYRIGAREGYKTFRETLVDTAKAPFRAFKKLNPQSAFRNPQSETIWALRDVSFEVKQGEVVGIIGRNGAGKSTLLKILSKITEPTEGRVELRGRVGSLLEIGSGFHSELTGHENVYLYGAILGMDRWEVTRKFDEIVAFAELEKFIDTPVKRYSSGMYMRLAFAVAAHLEPEILLVDEVLAVGDARFWSKSIRRMRELNELGMTIFLVSHNMWLIQTISSRAILLEKGHIRGQGEALKVIEAYKRITHDANGSKEDDLTSTTIESKPQAKITLFEVLPKGNWATEKKAFPDSGVRIVISTKIRDISQVKFLIRLTGLDGFAFYTIYSDMISVPQNEEVKCEAVVEHLMLLPGEYLIWGAVCSEEGEANIMSAESASLFVKGDEQSLEKYSLFWNQAFWRILS